MAIVTGHDLGGAETVVPAVVVSASHSTKRGEGFLFLGGEKRFEPSLLRTRP